MIRTLILAAGLASAAPVLAAPARDVAPAPAAQGERAVIKVNGMVCDFCARSLERVMSRRREVATVTVDLDSAEIRVAFRPGRTIPDADLRKLVTDAGYATVSIQRAPV
jgi:copper chaperone CopZ